MMAEKEQDEDFFDDDPDGEDFEFDCPRFWTPEGWFCPAQGSEDCDWECPHSR
jgi:hypothetical protein